MARRSITDEEIGLIKTMLRRGMRNRDIQFYFNRQDRPVNSGRITGINAGDYGPEVPAATEAALDAFLAGFAPAEVGVVVEAGAAREQTLAERAVARFVQRDGTWFLADGETSDQECKAQFDPRRMEPVVRAIAAMANNRGGFVFIGVQDAECCVTGMPDTAFQDTDIVRITDKVKNLLTPIPALQEALAILSKDAPTFLLTEYGRPFSVAGFGNWMRDRCDEAGLPNCSSHGLRKACSRRLAERGCTFHEIKAITGHKTDAEVRRYTDKADQVRLAHRALEKLQDTANNPKSANPL